MHLAYVFSVEDSKGRINVEWDTRIGAHCTRTDSYKRVLKVQHISYTLKERKKGEENLECFDRARTRGE